MTLYQTPILYDLYYNQANERPLKDHYERLFQNKSIKSIHDCSIGTGNLSLVLAEMGYDLSGSDLSPQMLDHCADKAEKRALKVKLKEADFTCLDLDDSFDMVMCTGNSLAHVNDACLVDALLSMKKHINNGGYLYLDLRNWDKIIETQNRFQVYPPLIEGDKRTNVSLVRDYHEDHITYNFLYTMEINQKIVETEVRHAKYYPVLKDRLLDVLKGLGFVEIELFNFLDPKTTSYDKMGRYCILCRKESF